MTERCEQGRHAEPVASPEQVEHQLRELLAHVDATASSNAALVEGIHPDHRDSARNLLHYIAIRQHDLRPLQRDLAAYGLSSLGRMEAMVRSWLLTVIETTAALHETRARHEIWGPLDDGPNELRRNRDILLGPVRDSDRTTRIMVTMPSEAAHDDELVDGMAQAGMDIARINLAHDGVDEWASMVARLRQLDAPVLVAMDLAGPKLRTGPLEAGPEVVKVKPERDLAGRVVDPARVTLRAREDVPPFEGTTALTAAEFNLDDLHEGDSLSLRDARDRQRTFTVTAIEGERVALECDRTTYFFSGAELHDDRERLVASLAPLPEVPEHLVVRVGDELRLQRSMEPQAATRSGPHRIGCSLPSVFDDVRAGERVLFDDGKIAATIAEVTADEIVTTVTRAGVDGVKLRAEKGINFPDSALSAPALTDVDREQLPIVAEHADIVNASFVHSADDVAELIDGLESLGAHDIGIVLKIETRAAFEQLPQMLLEALRWRKVGVMIARGDLAVEVGFDRLAEVQEQILWVCEAARVPVIWATEVLGSLAKKGVPSRAEVTDAAMSRRAECVMLNKGPYIVTAIEALVSILDRMSGHVSKKRTLLRQLGSFTLE